MSLPVPAGSPVDHRRPPVVTDDVDVDHLDMVDDDALPQTRSLFAYLRAVGQAGYTLFGHQNDATDRIIRADTAVDWSGVDSDVYNAVGDFPAVHGYSPDQIAQVKDAYRKGAIVAVEHHIGFTAGRGVGAGSYGTTADPTDPVAQILPGGPLHESLRRYLDTVADWAGQYVDDNGNLIPVIYRPWHEHNGDWFWWGTSNATEGELRELFRFTVEYLRDVKGVANFIYAFSPNGHFENEEEYLYAYPGDEYVDLLGVDVYWDVPPGNPDWFDLLMQDLRIAVGYANRTGKIAALTETGIRWDANDGLVLQGAGYELNWFTTMQSRIKADPVAGRIAYMLVWRNGTTDHFWVPFRGHKVHGDHEMLPDFVDYHNRADVVFAGRVGEYAGLVRQDPGPGSGNRPYVKIHTPVFKKQASGVERVRVHPAAGYVPGDDAMDSRRIGATSVTVSLGGTDHAATRDEDPLFWVADVDTTLVEDGRHPVSVTATYGSTAAHEATDSHDILVVNRREPGAADPYLIDDFESYDSTDDNRTDLQRVWWRDGDTMIALRLRSSGNAPGSWLSHTWNNGMDTGAVLRVKYDAVRNSFAQVTRRLDNVDWSAAKSLSVRVQPDGKGHDVRFRFVVAGDADADADDRTFEVSFNRDLSKYGYDASLVAPQHVAVDLAEFRNVGTGLPSTPADRAQVTSFSIRFVQQHGMPEMAGLNALEYYLFDDLRVSEIETSTRAR